MSGAIIHFLIRSKSHRYIAFHDLAPSGYFATPRLRRRPVSNTNFDEWMADPRALTFEEYMAELIPDHRLPPAPLTGGTATLTLPEYTGQPMLPPNHRVP